MIALTLQVFADAARPDFTNGPDRPACDGLDVELFYPDRGAAEAYVQARRICAGCDVQAECLQWALDTDQRWGMWGATTPNERRRLRRRAA